MSQLHKRRRRCSICPEPPLICPGTEHNCGGSQASSPGKRLGSPRTWRNASCGARCGSMASMNGWGGVGAWWMGCVWCVLKSGDLPVRPPGRRKIDQNTYINFISKTIGSGGQLKNQTRQGGLAICLMFLPFLLWSHHQMHMILTDCSCRMARC